VEKRIIREQERVDLLLDQGCEGSIDVVCSAGFHDMELQPERERGLLHVSAPALHRASLKGHDSRRELGPPGQFGLARLCEDG
jgi:hypothetical protein